MTIANLLFWLSSKCRVGFGQVRKQALPTRSGYRSVVWTSDDLCLMTYIRCGIQEVYSGCTSLLTDVR
jgi:hypothetical protein